MHSLSKIPVWYSAACGFSADFMAHFSQDGVCVCVCEWFREREGYFCPCSNLPYSPIRAVNLEDVREWFCQEWRIVCVCVCGWYSVSVNKSSIPHLYYFLLCPVKPLLLVHLHHILNVYKGHVFIVTLFPGQLKTCFYSVMRNIFFHCSNEILMGKCGLWK